MEEAGAGGAQEERELVLKKLAAVAEEYREYRRLTNCREVAALAQYTQRKGDEQSYGFPLKLEIHSS